MLDNVGDATVITTLSMLVGIVLYLGYVFVVRKDKTGS